MRLLWLLTLLLFPPCAMALDVGVLGRVGEAASLQRQGEEDDVERRQLGGYLRWQHPGVETELLYLHTPVLIRIGEPASNGYFHQFDVGQSWHHGLWQVDWRLGLHGSSNMFGHGRYHSDALVGRVSAFRYRVWGSPWAVGLTGDHRFGGFRWYPRLARRITLPVGELQLDIPVSLTWQIPGRWRVGVERYGEKWGTLDGDREVEDRFYLQEWRATAWYRLGRIKGQLWLGAGVRFQTRVDYLDLKRGRLDEALGSTAFAALAWQW